MSGKKNTNPILGIRFKDPVSIIEFTAIVTHRRLLSEEQIEVHNRKQRNSRQGDYVLIHFQTHEDLIYFVSVARDDGVIPWDAGVCEATAIDGIGSPVKVLTYILTKEPFGDWLIKPVEVEAAAA